MGPRLRLALGSLAGALALWWPAFRSPSATGFGDWQYFHHMWEAGLVALTRFGEWPLWDPYHCGGITLVGNPQNQLWSPLFFPSLLLGTTLATKLFVVVHAWAGLLGMFVLARRELRLSVVAASLAACVWGGSGFFAWHGGGGHAAFMPFYLAPWVLLAWRAAASDPRHAVSVALLMTLVLLEGGVYPFPCLTLLLLVDAALRLCAREPWRGIVVAGALSGLLTALLGAVRLVPILDELARHPRTTPSADGLSLLELLHMLTARSHAWRVPGHPFVWAEYGTFVGYGAVVLGALGLLLAVHQRRYALLTSSLLFGALTLGELGPWSPWSLLHALPVFDSLRVPSRFAVLFTFHFALLAGLALEQLAVWLAARAHSVLAVRAAALVPVLVLAGVSADLLIVNLRTVDRWSYPPLSEEPPVARFHLTRRPYGRDGASLPRLQLGSRDCYEAMSFEVAQGLWLGDVAQARVLGGNGEVTAFGRTTAQAFAEVRMAGTGALLFNQNYAPGWRSSLGRAEADDRGRLVVRDVPAGEHRIELRYWPDTLTRGLWLSALGLLGAVAVQLRAWRWVRRRNA